MSMDSIYKFNYVPVGIGPAVIRHIDLSEILAIGMFNEGVLIGVQIDCKHRDAPLVIEILTEPHLLSLEIEKVRFDVDLLILSWKDFKKIGG